MTKETTRRNFLQTSTQAGAVVAAASTLGGVHVFAGEGPKQIRLAIIGCGNIMKSHVKRLLRRGDEVSIDWLCDVDPQQIEIMAEIISEKSTSAPRRTARYEDILEDSKVDACIIATPHHWHAPIALRAMKAGMHVYIEKPISHVFNEGPLVMAAAKKYGMVAQQGSQMRSCAVTLQADKLLRDGIIGDIKVARAWTAEKRTWVKPLADAEIPEGVDYERWLGPAPVRDFNPHRFHGTWRMFRDYANGEIGDDGIHDLDLATWGLGVDTLPKQITARGGRMMGENSASDYPDNMNVTYEYPDGRLIIYENLPFTEYGMHGYDNGNVFYGTEGYMVFSRRGAFNVFLGRKGTKGPTEAKEIRGQRGSHEHMTNFFQAIRGEAALNSPPEVAHRSCALVHLGDIAYQVRGQLDFDPGTERFVDCDEANALLGKKYRQPYDLG